MAPRPILFCLILLSMARRCHASFLPSTSYFYKFQLYACTSFKPIAVGLQVSTLCLYHPFSKLVQFLWSTYRCLLNSACMTVTGSVGSVSFSLQNRLPSLLSFTRKFEHLDDPIHPDNWLGFIQLWIIPPHIVLSTFCILAMNFPPHWISSYFSLVSFLMWTKLSSQK